MVSVEGECYKSCHHFVRFGRYEKIDRFVVDAKGLLSLNLFWTTPDILSCEQSNSTQIG